MLIVFSALPPAVLNYMIAERYNQQPRQVDPRQRPVEHEGSAEQDRVADAGKVHQPVIAGRGQPAPTTRHPAACLLAGQAQPRSTTDT